MRKTGLFKIIMFILLGIVVTTWIFSASYINNGELVELGMYNVGFFDFFQLLFGSFEFEYFIQIFILLVSIGALYGVLGKTGKYRAWIEKVANKMKDGADDETKKKHGELALALTNIIKKTNGSLVVTGKIIISIINAYYKELRSVVKQLKPKEKSANNAGGDESAQSGGDKNATAMFAFL